MSSLYKHYMAVGSMSSLCKVPEKMLPCQQVHRPDMAVASMSSHAARAASILPELAVHEHVDGVRTQPVLLIVRQCSNAGGSSVAAANQPDSVQEHLIDVHAGL